MRWKPQAAALLATAFLMLAVFGLASSVKAQESVGVETPVSIEPVVTPESFPTAEVPGELDLPATAAPIPPTPQITPEAIPSPEPAPTPKLELIWPYIGFKETDFRTTQGVHGESYGHKAIDIAAGKGANILSPCDCKVTGRDIDQWGNPFVELTELDGEYRHLFLHGDYVVEVGQEVQQGEIVGYESNHGYTVCGIDAYGNEIIGQNNGCGYHSHWAAFDAVTGAPVYPGDLVLGTVVRDTPKLAPEAATPPVPVYVRILSEGAAFLGMLACISTPALILVASWILTHLGPAAEKAGMKRNRERSVRWALKLAGLVVTWAGAMYVTGFFIYQPIWPKSEVVIETAEVKISVLDVYTPSAETLKFEDVDCRALAEASNYGSPELLCAFLRHAVPRGPNGFPTNDGTGKVFPPALAAAIPLGETITGDWEADPRQPGPWGRYLAWDSAASHFSDPTQLQACYDGLEEVAANPVVQAKYPGITARTIYSSAGCSIGRGQIWAAHFAPGGMFYGLSNKDVWNDLDVAVETIYIHLVARASPACGSTDSWYHSGNTEVALCSYNPNSWDVPAHAWYWDGIRGKRDEIEEAWRIVAGDRPMEVTTSDAGESIEVTIAQPQLENERPIEGSGPYAAWDTPLSLSLRFLRTHQPEMRPEFLIRFFNWVGLVAFSDANEAMLGFE